MAKKSSTNAVKKLDKQINELKKNSTKKDDDKTPVISKKELKAGIEKAQSSKGTKSKKSSGTKKKSTTKKSATKTTSKKTNTTKTKSNTKNTTTKKKTTTTKKTAKKSTTKKSSSTNKRAVSKKVTKDNIVVTPSKKNIQIDDKDAVRDDIVVSPDKKEKDIKKELSEKKSKKEDIVVTPEVKKKDSKSKKIKAILTKKKNDEVIDLDDDNKIEESKFANEIEEDISNSKYIDKAKVLLSKAFSGKKGIKRKRKGKNKYVVDLDSTKEYKNLERDLRSLYDKTNDIVEDIDKTQDLEKTIKTIDGLIIEDNSKPEKKNFLDCLSQKVLNIFIVALLGIFIIMVIIVIGLIIYVSTA